LANGFQIASPDTEVFGQAAHAVIQKHQLDTRSLDAFEQLYRNPDGSPICPEMITEDAAIDFWDTLERQGFLDFCSIVYWTYHLITEHESITRGLASRFTWILVDEFQDTSEIQVEILAEIAGVGRTQVFAVGDPLQSIYGFGGARPELVDAFAKRVAARQDFALRTNFRSSERIVEHAERLFRRTPPMKGEGLAADFDFEPLHVEAQTRFDAITDYFLPILEDYGITYGEAAILASTWYPLLPLARQLREYGIPVVGPGARPYKATRAFARLAEQVCAYVARPRPERVHEIEKELFLLLANLNGKPDFEVFTYDGRRLVFDLVRIGKELRDKSQGGRYWLEAASAAFGQVLCVGHWTNQAGVARLQESAGLMLADMDKRKVDIDNVTIADIGMFACPDANLKLLTLHGAKGREFDAVALVDLHEGRIPHWSINDNLRLQESKRLFYVGVTRARKILVYVTDQSDHRNRPTRFLAEVSARFVNTEE
jgi:DNA helicase-2/ATP-dependent DNA helicase PcrA